MNLNHLVGSQCISPTRHSCASVINKLQDAPHTLVIVFTVQLRGKMEI